MAKRAKESNDSIRDIFREETPLEPEQQLEFPIIESTLQKARRRSRSLIQTSIYTFDESVGQSIYNQIEGGPFYRGLVESENGQQAAIFISDVVASKLGRINKIFFDGTFKTSPAIYCMRKYFRS